MRILYLSDNCSDHNLRFLQKLTSLGCEVTFIDLAGHRFGDRLPCGVDEVRFESIFNEESGPERIRSIVAELDAIIDRFRPDLVHAGPIPTSGYLAALADFHPLVLMSWGSDLLLNATCSSYSRVVVALRAADGFVCDSDTVLSAGRQYAALPDSQVSRFPWGITAGSFSPGGPVPSRRIMPFGKDTVKLISTRSWEPVYRTNLLLQAFLCAHAQEERLRLLLLGSGSESKQVRDFISRNHSEHVILTPGPISHSELPAWFRAADGYVSCAETDGTSVSLLEAMATGLPVVVTDIPSNREWVSEDENGWLASDVNDFAWKFLRIVSLTSPERLAISERNQRVVKLRADWDENFPKLLQLYKRVVSQYKRGTCMTGEIRLHS